MQCLRERRPCRSMQKPNDKDGSVDNKTLSQVVKKQCLHCLPSDPTVRKEWIDYFVSNCVHCVFTIALSLLTDLYRVFWHVLSCLCVSDLNHSSIYLWGIYTVKHTQLLANHNSDIYYNPTIYNPPHWWGGLKTGQKIAYSKLCFLMKRSW